MTHVLANYLQAFFRLCAMFLFFWHGQAWAQLGPTPYPTPNCTANDATISGIATSTFTIVDQCALPTDFATMEFDISYSQNASSRYDLVIGTEYDGNIIVQEFFSDVRTGGDQIFLDLDGEADAGDSSSLASSNVIVQMQIPCDVDNDGAIDLSPTFRFAVGYNAAQGGSGLPTDISAPKCAISEPVSLPLTTSITIVKDVINDEGGTSTVSDFGITTDAGGLTFDSGTTNGSTSTTTYTSEPIVALSAGTYSLTELDLGIYTEGTWSCSEGTVTNSGATTGAVTLVQGDNTLCTIVNDDIAFVPAPANTIDKAAPTYADVDGSGTYNAGDTLEYTITATNTGNIDLTNVVVSDPLLTASSTTCATVPISGTCVLTGTYTLTQADIDAGTFSNTAQVISTELPTALTDTEVTNIPQVEDLAIVKPAPANADGDGSGDISVGDVLTYTVTATNSGTTTLSNVVVSDSLISPSSNSCTSLAPGATCVLSGTYTVTQTDVDNGAIDNTAGVVSDEITTPVEATNTVNPVQTDELSIVKPAPANADGDGSGDVSVNDILTYTVTATNSGTTTLSNVVVSDSLISPSSNTCATLAPGATCVLTGTYTVTQADIDNGAIDNTAGVVSDEITTPVEASNTTTASQTDDLSIVKPAPNNADGDGSGDISVGDVLTYTITATNSGTTTLNNVVVSDALITPSSNTCATLAPTATCVLTGTYTVTQTDIDNGSIDNTAGVVSNEITTPVEATNTSTPNIVDDLTIVKPAPVNADEDGSSDVSLGDTLTYTVTATNSGTTTLSSVVVSDNLIAPSSNTCATLAPGATCVLMGTYSVTQADVDNGSIDNTAGVVSNEITTPEEATNTTNTGQNDDLSIVKPAPANADKDGSGDVSVGDTLTYTVTATNSGTTTLNNVVVSDNLITPSSNTCASVAPGATCVLTGNYTVTQADIDAGAIDNTAGVVSDEITTPVEASNTTNPAQSDDLSIVKPAPTNADEDGSADVSLGDTLTYVVTATNSGTTTLTNVVVSDNLITPNSNTCATLAPGATCVLTGDYTVTQADVDNGSIANTADVISAEITTPVEASNTTNTGQNDDLSIVKPAPNNADEDGSSDISVGDTLTYTITATNSGTTTLSNVIVSDALVTPNSNTCATLVPGATCVLIGTYSVTQTDIDNGSIDNTAGVVSTEITTPVEASNSAIPNIVDDLTLVKPAPANADGDASGDVSVGDVLTYTVTATNSGTTTLSNVIVSDALITPNSNTCATLAPGATCVLTGTYTVTQTDVDNGSIDNTAGVISNEITTPVEASNTTNTGQNNDLTIVKPAPANADEDGSGDVSVGDTLTYTVTATNSGTTTLNNVVVSDNLITPNSNTCVTLAPGSTCVLTGTYAVTQADIDAGTIENTAGVVSDEITTPVEASNTTNAAQTDDLSIVKPAPVNADEDGSSDVSVGDTLTYTITATNSGTTTLSNVVVSDALITPNSNSCATLAPGATCVLTGTYTVAQTDVDNGSIDNTAGVVSAEITTPVEASNTTNTGQNDNLSIVKPAPANADEDGSGNVSVGDTLTYTVTATNSGTTTLNNVVVSDTLITPSTNTCVTLAPGATCILTGTYTVTQTDVDNGTIDNTAGVISDEITTPVEASNTTNAEQRDDLTIIKPAPANADEDGSGDISLGDTLTYTVTATNSGTTTQSNVVVTDNLITPNTNTCATLAPGATCALTGTYTVTQTDVDNGSITNTAGVVSSEIPTAVEASNTANTGQNDGLSIAKPAPNNADEDGSGNISVGDTLTYTITATNSGTTTLTNVIVSDAMVTPNSETCASVIPGGTCILMGTYTVTQTDIDNGTIDNTAGVVSNEITTPVEASNTSTPNIVDELTIVKPAPANADEDGSGDVSLGDTLTYTVTATNSGTTTLTGVTVSDALITPNSNTCATLAPGATCVLTGTYTVTQTDVDNGSIANTAGVISNELTTPEEATNTTNTGQNDALSIVKPAPANADEDGSGDVSLGDTLTYTVTATNSGTTTLTNVIVNDSMITPSMETCATLAPGATCVLTGTYTVTQTDVDNGVIDNTAMVASVEISTPETAVQNQPVGQFEELSIVKPAPANADEDGSGDASVGDTLTYTVTATNSGTTTLTGVVVTDNLITPNTTTCATLLPGATCVLSGTYSVTQTDVDNGAIDNVAGVVSNEITTPVEATNTTNTGQIDALSIVKPAPANADEDGSGDVSVGDTLTYTVTATNAGTTTLTGVIVSDTLITPSTNTCPTLLPGATCVLSGTYSVTQADVDNGSIDNVAGVVSNELTTPEEATNTTNTGQNDALSIVKPAPSNADQDGSGDVSVGDTLTYTVTATNSGTTTLTDVTVSDALITPNSNVCASLAPGATCVLTGTYTVTQSDVDNGSIANTAGVVSNEITTPEEATNTTNTGQTDALSIVKPAPTNADQDGSGDISVGDTLTYTITATNSGTTTLNNVAVTDNMVSPGYETCASVAPGATCVLTGIYIVTQADVDNGAIVNTAGVISDEIPTSEEATQTTIIGQVDGLSIAKPAPANADEDGSGDISVGDTLTYTVTATNSGTTTLSDVVVSDALITPNSNTCATLAPSATCVLTGTYTVTQTDVDNGSIDNLASVVSNEVTTPEEATNTVTTGQVDALSIAKPAPANADEDGSGDVSVGDTLTYTVTATNSGTTTLTGVTVSDAFITPNSNVCATLAPNATCVLTGTYTVTQADVDNGDIVNTAGVVSNEITTPEEATNTTTTGQVEALSIVKPTPVNSDEDGSGDVSLGDTLTYIVTATNSGTTTLTGVIVSDALITPNSNSCATLAPGATCVLTGTYTVTQADVDDGDIVNTASVVSNEIPTPQEAVNTMTTGQFEELSLVKPAPTNADQDGSGDISLGDTLTYTVTATNSGTTTLTGVTVSDALITPSSNVCATVLPGAACVLTGTYTVTQADVDSGAIDNLASVVSNEITTPEEATNTSNTGQAPELTLTKPAPVNADQDGSGDVSLGDTLTYTVTATNSGTITLTNVIVNDAMITPSTQTCASVPVGGSCVLTGAYSVTQADVDAGTIDNTAMVASVEVATPVTANNNQPVGQLDALTLVKPAPANADQDGSGDLSVGDTLTYTVTATNSGTTTLTDVVVSDALITPNSNTCAVLAPNATCVLSGTYTVTQADVDNGDIVNAADVVSNEVTTAVEATNTSPTGQTPALTLVKPAPANMDQDGSGDITLGDTLTYTVTATNSGTVTLTDVVVSDALITPNSNTCATLVPGATCVLTGIYTVVQTDIDNGGITNNASVVSNEVTTPVDATNTSPTAQTPDLTLVKPAPVNGDQDGSGDVSLGDILTYTVTATNNGTITLTDVVVTDAMITPSTTTCAAVVPGATCVLTGTYTVTQADVDNGAIANTASVESNEVTTPVDANNTQPVGQNPALELVKPAPVNGDQDGSGSITAGDVLTYTITATNSGNLTLSNVNVTDAMITPNSQVCASLAPGGTCVLTGLYTVRQSDIDNGEIVNNAEVTSTEVTTPVPATNTTPAVQTPDLTLDKPAPANADGDGSGNVSLGDVLTYTITATNTGNVTLTNVMVNDPMTTPSVRTCASLAVGDSCVLTGNYTVTQADVDNGSIVNNAMVASVEIATPETATNTSNIIQLPELSLTKPAPANADEDNTASVSLGDTLTYTVTATNTGSVTLSNVVVTDPITTPNTQTCAVLAPGETCILTGAYAVSQDDVNLGAVANTALVQSTEIPTPVQATNNQNVDQTTGLEVTKPAPVNADEDGSGDVSVGDTLTYTVTAINTGTTVLTNVVVSDTMTTPNSQTCAALLPSASCVLTGTYTVTQADVDAGEIVNNASAQSNEINTPATATQTETVPQTGSLAVLKTGVVNNGLNGYANIDDTITYTFEVINTGVVTLTDITLEDPLVEVEGGPIASLAPGESDTTTFTATYFLTPDDLDAQSVLNTATVAGRHPNGNRLFGLSDDPTDLNNEDEDGDGNPDDPTVTNLVIGPTSLVQPLSVTKTTPYRDVSFGDLVPYEIIITNNDDFDRTNLTYVDLMPTGFNYVPDSAQIDGVGATPVVIGNQVTFPNQTLAADDSVQINLVLVVGAGVTEGEYVNQASVVSTLSGALLSEIGEATVIVGPTPVFDCAEIIGKVFDDRNMDGYQNRGEDGVADVRVATVKGQLVTTDAHGRFHIACAQIPNAQIGSNFIMKLDPRSLPTGYRITTENPRVVRLTRGKLTKLNFGVTRPRIVTLDLSQQVFLPQRNLLVPAMQPNIAMLIDALRKEESILRINYHSVPGEPNGLVQSRMKIVTDHINHLWEQQACCYDLTIETKTISMGSHGAAGYKP